MKNIIKTQNYLCQLDLFNAKKKTKKKKEEMHNAKERPNIIQLIKYNLKMHIKNA